MKVSRRHPERGSVLLLALLLTLLVVGLGLAALWLSSARTRVSRNTARQRHALHAAEAGLDLARAILSQRDWNVLLDGTPCGAPAFPGKGRLLCDGSAPVRHRRVFEISSSNPASRARGLAAVTYTVYIRNDPAEAGGDAGVRGDDQDQRIFVRSEGLGRRGASYAAIEALVSRHGRLVLVEAWREVR
jgi:hypothetical protein